MLILKPNCEMCDKDLPAEAPNARICSYECTFCSDCVDTVLHNVCPNCAGGFVPRPIRPLTARRAGVSRKDQSASTQRVHLKYSSTDIAAFVERAKDLAPEDR